MVNCSGLLNHRLPGHVGSNPTLSANGPLAQLVEAPALGAGCSRFESVEGQLFCRSGGNGRHTGLKSLQTESSNLSSDK
jgi:hypothetical protein